MIGAYGSLKVEQSHQDFERFERRQEACRSASQALSGLYASFAANWTAVQQRESSADSKMYAALYNAVPYVDVDAIAFLKVTLPEQDKQVSPSIKSNTEKVTDLLRAYLRTECKGGA